MTVISTEVRVGVQVTRGQLPVTLNVARQSKQMWRLNKELADWRAWAHREADTRGLPPLRPPVVVVVEHLRKNRGSMPDTGAPILAVKAVIDGLVDAGVLPDDGPDVVQRLTFDAPAVVGYHGLRVTITETEPAATQGALPL